MVKYSTGTVRRSDLNIATFVPSKTGRSLVKHVTCFWKHIFHIFYKVHYASGKYHSSIM